VAERVFQRATWDGTPREVAQWWTLKKGQRRAICRMFTHVFGHELRLEVSRELVSSEVCRTDEEILSCQEKWRAGLEGKGHRYNPCAALSRESALAAMAPGLVSFPVCINRRACVRNAVAETTGRGRVR
jgi:hypothetical protein